MRSRRYLEEIGLPANERPVSKPVAGIALALISLAAVFLLQKAAVSVPAHHPTVEPSPAVAVARR